MLIVPLLFPHVELTAEVARPVGPGVFTMVAVVLKVQPCTSFTITVYVPAAKPAYLVAPVNGLPFTE